MITSNLRASLDSGPRSENESSALIKRQNLLSKKIIDLELISEKSFQGNLSPEDLPYKIPFSVKPLICSVYNALKTRNLIPFEGHTALPFLREIYKSYQEQQTIRTLPPFEKIFDTVAVLQEHSVFSLRKKALVGEWLSNDKKLKIMGVEYVYLSRNAETSSSSSLGCCRF